MYKAVGRDNAVLPGPFIAEPSQSLDPKRQVGGMVTKIFREKAVRRGAVT